MKHRSTNSPARVFFKIALSSAIVFAAGFGVLQLDAERPWDPARAQADIVARFAPRSQQQQFTRTLQDEGFEPPRMYTMNGVPVYFSVSRTSQTPREVLSRMQYAFYRDGINKKLHLEPVEIRQALGVLHSKKNKGEHNELLRARSMGELEKLNDYFQGGLIPVVKNDNYVAMAGTTIPDLEGSDDHRANKRALESTLEQIKRGGGLMDSARTMRYVEAFRTPNQDNTTAIAIWSDENFEMGRLVNKHKRSPLHSDRDPDIPLCVGCERLMRFAGTGRESRYIQHIIEGPDHPNDMTQFYQRELTSRGWQISQSNRALDELQDKGVMPVMPQDARMTAFTRGAEHLTMLSYRPKGTMRSVVQFMSAP